MLCEYYESSDHDTCNCPYRGYADAKCASVEKKSNELAELETMKVRIAEYSQCFNQSRENYGELDSSLWSPKPKVSFYDDFDSSYLTRPNLKEDMPLPSLEPESDTPTSLSQDLAPHTSSPKDVTRDVLVPSNPPTTLNDFVSFRRVNTLRVLVS